MTTIQNANTVNIYNNNNQQLDDVKVCKGCLTVKSLDAFKKYKYKGQVKYYGKCKSCCKCEHGRNKSECKDCGGSSICEHNLQRHQCKQCNDPIKVTIKRIIDGSRQTDKKYNRYDPDNFIDKPFLTHLINQRKKCYWCECELIYDEKYASNLGTIERLDNSLGHVKSNCTLACFSCNSAKKSNK